MFFFGNIFKAATSSEKQLILQQPVQFYFFSKFRVYCFSAEAKTLQMPYSDNKDLQILHRMVCILHLPQTQKISVIAEKIVILLCSQLKLFKHAVAKNFSHTLLCWAVSLEAQLLFIL